jgi:(S)-sulfolactate dehydrogenase
VNFCTQYSMNILISEFMDDAAVEKLRAAFPNTHYDATLVDQPEALRARAAQCDALIVRNRTQVRGALLDACSRVKVIGRLGVGLDNIDVATCDARKIAVIPATGANALAVAEYVITTAMVLVRGAYQSSAEVGAGAWPRNRLSNGREISGKTLGLVGFGGIGQLTALLARGLGMQVLAYDPMLPEDASAWGIAQRASLDEVLQRADVVSLHVPLTPDTKLLMNAARLARMKKEAVLINTSRGGMIDESALALALKSGALGGAALDVFEPEPMLANGPLQDVPNCILTPHIAGVTAESNVRVSHLIADRIIAHLSA